MPDFYLLTTSYVGPSPLFQVSLQTYLRIYAHDRDSLYSYLINNTF